MNITDEQREAVARLEAKIRGLGWAGRIDTLPSANEVYASILVVGKSKDDASVGRTYLAATPPDTAEGREWWAERLGLDVIYERGDISVGVPPEWVVAVVDDDERFSKRLAWSGRRTEAITAAIVAVAESEFPDD